MESGGRANRRRRCNTGTSTPGMVIGATTNRRPYQRNRSPQQTSRHRRDQCLPMAKVAEIMRHALPAHANIDDDAKEAIQACVYKFICFVTTEANRQCHQDSRNTVNPVDLLSAMSTLGFDNYIEPLTLYLSNYRAQDTERSSVHHGPFVTHTTSYMQEPAAQMARSTSPPTFTKGYNPTQQLTSQMVRPPPSPPPATAFGLTLYAPPLASQPSLTIDRRPPPPPSTMAYGLTLQTPPPPSTTAYGLTLHTPPLAPQPSLTIDQRPTQFPADLRNYVEFVNNYFMKKQDGGEGSSRGRAD